MYKLLVLEFLLCFGIVGSDSETWDFYEYDHEKLNTFYNLLGGSEYTNYAFDSIRNEGSSWALL